MIRNKFGENNMCHIKLCVCNHVINNNKKFNVLSTLEMRLSELCTLAKVWFKYSKQDKFSMKRLKKIDH
jgi:hypothetical protein